MFEQIPSNHPSWDWKFTALSKEQGYKMLCTKDSYADHIGKYGVHSIKGNEGDEAQNFLGE